MRWPDAVQLGRPTVSHPTTSLPGDLSMSLLSLVKTETRLEWAIRRLRLLRMAISEKKKNLCYCLLILLVHDVHACSPYVVLFGNVIAHGFDLSSII